MTKNFLTFIFFLFFSVAFLHAQKLEVGTYTFPKTKAVYTGEMIGKKPYGKGHTVFVNGDSYEGMYENGKRQGYGTYLYADGEKYEGEWYKDQQHGRGTYYFINNNRYEGLWYRDVRDVLLQWRCLRWRLEARQA